MAIVKLHYKVFGTVQKVFFRAHTKKRADILDIKGYVKNAADGTVEGIGYGTREAIDEFKKWLETKGSPRCTIERCEFEEEEVEKSKYKSFSIKREVLPNGKQWA
eukprot:m.22015 g.22015  ORF g.22015 m.22015 type:complete len:105 (-) comp7316_c0_seq1:1271-1585(-)